MKFLTSKLFYVFVWIMCLGMLACGRNTGKADLASGGGVADCDDHNPCTTDTLEAQQCKHTPLPLGTVCGSSEAFCNSEGVCEQIITRVTTGSTADVNNFTVKIYPGSRVVALEVATDTDYQFWRSSTASRHFGYNNATKALTRKLYQIFKDNFDQLIFIDNEATPPSGVSSMHVAVQNYIQGLGLQAPLDEVSNFVGESASTGGRLQSVIHLLKRDALRHGPSLHEILHRFGNNIFFTSDNCASNHSGHFGFSSAGSQLGGWSKDASLYEAGGQYTPVYQLNLANVLVPTNIASFGTFANNGNSIPYAPIDLYLMGLKTLSELVALQPTLKIAKGAAWVPQSIASFTATQIVSIDMQQFFTDRNVRLAHYDQLSGYAATYREAYADSVGVRQDSRAGVLPQTHYQALVVYVTLASNPLTVADWLSLAEDVRKFSLPGDDQDPQLYNFYEATGGLATMAMDLARTSLR